MESGNNKKAISQKRSRSLLNRKVSDQPIPESRQSEDQCVIIPAMSEEEKSTLVELLQILDAIDKRAKGIRTT
jgi:hypothetical protein